MKKKTFYQTNILWQLFCSIVLAVFVLQLIVGVQAIINIVKNGLHGSTTEIVVVVVVLILYYIAVILTFRVFLRFEHNNVHLTCDKIYMNDDWMNKKNKIQHYAEVKYVDIVSVDIIWTSKDSKGKRIESLLMASAVEKPYVSIRNKNGDTVNFCVIYIAKKDVIKLINELKIRMRNVGNDAEVIEDKEALKKLSKKIYIDV